MAKLKYETLRKKYDNFTVASSIIDIDGYDAAKSFKVNYVEVQLTSQFEASYTEFHIVNAYSIGSDGFTLASSIKSKVKLGKPVTVSVGYKDETTEIFKGYIDSIETIYDEEEGMRLQVTCLDAKGLMMNSCRSEIKTNVKKYSDAVSKTFGLYPDFITSKAITATDELTVPIHQLDESDYDFVVRIAKKLGYCFYILLGKAYFQPYAENPAELIELTPFTRIKSFNLQSCIRKRVAKVIVVNNDESDEKKRIKSEITQVNSIESQSTVKAKSTAAMSDNMVKTIIDHSATTPDLAKKFAQAEIDRLSRYSVEGEIELPGIPDLMPGNLITLSGFSESLSKSYYIKKVIHRISDLTYFTTLEIGGNSL